jgi:acetyl/propionyl-CoA carboxylase alpha subunit
VVEEAPSAVVSPDMRRKMGEAAVNVARSCNYTGAGTVEFLVDANMNYYFLEMNTRLQVEHPVTEMITGLDLVREQINIARGNPLPFRQEDLQLKGHAVELRVYAENPLNNFLPDIGTLTTYRPPKGPGIRVDDGYEEGMTIPIYYDPMLSKLVTYGRTRQQAMDRMIEAIDNYQITGVATTLAFGKYVMQHEAFRTGHFDTHFVQNHYDPSRIEALYIKEAEVAALLGATELAKPQYSGDLHLQEPTVRSNWKVNRTHY